MQVNQQQTTIANTPQSNAVKTVPSKKSTILTILLLIFIFPVGLIVMWIWARWKLWIKILITSIFLLIMVVEAVVAFTFLNRFNRDSACLQQCSNIPNHSACFQSCIRQSSSVSKENLQQTSQSLSVDTSQWVVYTSPSYNPFWTDKQLAAVTPGDGYATPQNIKKLRFTIKHPSDWQQGYDSVGFNQDPKYGDGFTFTKGNYEIRIAKGYAPGGNLCKYNPAQYTQIKTRDPNFTLWKVKAFDITTSKVGYLQYELCTGNTIDSLGSVTKVGRIIYTVPQQYDSSTLSEMDNILSTITVQNTQEISPAKHDLTGKTVPIQGSDWLRYTDSNAGFRIDIPKGWYISFSPAGEIGDYQFGGAEGIISASIRTNRGDYPGCAVINGKVDQGPYVQSVFSSNSATLTIQGTTVHLCQLAQPNTTVNPKVVESYTTDYELINGKKVFNGDIDIFVDVNSPANQNRQTVFKVLQNLTVL